MKEAMVGDTIFPADELLVTIPGTPVKSREEIERVAFPTRSVSREEIKTAFDAEVKRIADRFGSELYRSQHIFNCEMRRLCSLLPASAEIPTASRILLIVVSEWLLPLALKLRILTGWPGASRIQLHAVNTPDPLFTRPIRSYIIYGVERGDCFRGARLSDALSAILRNRQRPLLHREALALAIAEPSLLLLERGLDCAYSLYSDGAVVLWRPNSRASFDYRSLQTPDSRFITPSCAVSPITVQTDQSPSFYISELCLSEPE